MPGLQAPANLAIWSIQPDPENERSEVYFTWQDTSSQEDIFHFFKNGDEEIGNAAGPDGDLGSVFLDWGHTYHITVRAGKLVNEEWIYSPPSNSVEVDLTEPE